MSAYARPARPRLSRAQRREQLLEAARDAFVQTGYHATAMDDIADRAGVSKPVLYQHFSSKLDLYLGLLDQQAQTLIELIEQALDSTEDNQQRIAATVEAYFDFVDTPEGAYRLVFESDLVAEAAVKSRVEAVTDACAGALARVIQEDTGLDDEHAFLLGVCLAGMAQACAARWVALGRSVPRAEAAALVRSLGWKGLGSFPLSRPEG